MERHPYQEPQTAIERHIAGLVEHLKNGTDSRSGFAEKVEQTMAHAFWLEAEYRRLVRENRELEDALCVGTPSVTASWEAMGPIAPTRLYQFDWIFEPIRWRCMLRPFQAEAEEKNWRRIRRATFKKVVKLVREQFDKTFPERPNFTANDRAA